MKSIRLMLAGASLLLLCSCGAQVQKETQVANANESKENAVIETIMSRRSIRQYKPHSGHAMRNRTDILFAADQTKQSLYVLFILCHLLLLLPSWAMSSCLNKFILTHLFKQVKVF